MKVTIETAENIINGLKPVMNKELPAAVAFQIGGIYESLRPDVARYQQTVNNLVIKYGEKREEDEYFKVTQENHDTYTKEVESLQDAEIEAPDNKIKFTDIQHLTFTVQEMAALKRFIEDAPTT